MTMGSVLNRLPPTPPEIESVRPLSGDIGCDFAWMEAKKKTAKPKYLRFKKVFTNVMKI
jgi:hypothetical protein